MESLGLGSPWGLTDDGVKRSDHGPFLGISTPVQGRLWNLSIGEKLKFLRQL